MHEVQANGERQMVKVGSSIKHRRVDKYLRVRFGNLSRVMIQNAIKAGAVKVNGREVKPSFKLKSGDMIDLTVPEPPSREIVPEEIALDILYEDADIIVLNKQARMIVHPARGNTGGTLVNGLAFYSDRLSSGLGEFRPGIVHRLDKNTTGVMVVTRNETAQWKVARQFQNRQVRKSYLAVVHGVPELTSDRIKAPLGVHPRVRQRYAVRPETGRSAVTIYEVLEAFRGFSLLQLRPRTGRTHQIRVHLSYMKHPVVADDMYGGKLVYRWQLADCSPACEQPLIDRCALHARTLGFTHPSTGKWVEFEAPMPEDMRGGRRPTRQSQTIRRIKIASSFHSSQ